MFQVQSQTGDHLIYVSLVSFEKVECREDDSLEIRLGQQRPTYGTYIHRWKNECSVESSMFPYG
jgi:hypothetical protein